MGILICVKTCNVTLHRRQGSSGTQVIHHSSRGFRGGPEASGASQRSLVLGASVSGNVAHIWSPGVLLYLIILSFPFGSVVFSWAFNFLTFRWQPCGRALSPQWVPNTSSSLFLHLQCPPPTSVPLFFAFCSVSTLGPLPPSPCWRLWWISLKARMKTCSRAVV